MRAGYVAAMLGPMRWHRLVALLALTGCAGSPDCTLVGCASQLTVRLPAGATSGQACVAGVCTSEVVDGTLLVPLGRRADGDTAQVTLTTGGASYEGEVALARTRPNGDGCPPVCVNGAAVLDGGRVVSAPSA
jgi:hypothetical protein